MDKAKFEEEWNLKKLFIDFTNKKILIMGRPEDIEAAIMALLGKIANRQLVRETIRIESYVSSLLLNKLVPYGAKIKEIEEKYNCLLQNRK